MKQPLILILLMVALSFASCQFEASDKRGERIPRVAYLTTGNESGDGELPSGVIIAQRFFNSQGALCFIETRDILIDPAKLAEYDIIIANTAVGYHDADRQYSLSFMADFELSNLAQWVEQGGFLLAGDNIGRNQTDGSDRISLFGELNSENWPLADVFGVSLKELNMKGFRVQATDSFMGSDLIPPSLFDQWALVPDSSKNFKGDIRAWWNNDTLRYPAVVWNHYGDGQAILLPSSYLIHPSNEGGYRGIAQIEGLFAEILASFGYSEEVQLNFWPGASDHVLAITLRPDGDDANTETACKFFEDLDVPVTLFQSQTVDASTMKKNLGELCEVTSNGASMVEYGDLGYPQTLNEIVANHEGIQSPYSGFRFPFSRQSYWGLLALENMGYQYESSIPVDQHEHIRGSPHPYHLPISSRGYFTTLELLEICPLSHDDYFYFGDVATNNPITLEKKSLLFDAYLQKMLNELVIPYRGVMVYLGQNSLTFTSDTSAYPLSNLVGMMQENGSTWFATLSQIAARWNSMESSTFHITENGRSTRIHCVIPAGMEIEDLSFRVSTKPTSARARVGKAAVVESKGQYYLVAEGVPDQEIIIRW